MGELVKVILQQEDAVHIVDEIRFNDLDGLLQHGKAIWDSCRWEKSTIPVTDAAALYPTLQWISFQTSSLKKIRL
ncbi:MAG: hypothetical protein IJH65_06820 [Methanobrevibacter sp.]|nr:hypothetical protein [Methanobrevibacter sp.]